MFRAVFQRPLENIHIIFMFINRVKRRVPFCLVSPLGNRVRQHAAVHQCQLAGCLGGYGIRFGKAVFLRIWLGVGHHKTAVFQ